ncbi:MAG: hypothetical protein HC859_16115 [Bacteroidia bacterium]|nr:hypothetical protein [Bacteroidia bacterium]
MNKSFLRAASVAAIVGVSLISACVDEDRLTVQDVADVTEEAVSDYYYQDMDDMSGVTIGTPTDEQYEGGRVAATYNITVNDDRMQCGGVVVTLETGENSTPDVPTGVITVDFGTTGCTDLRGNVRKGKIIFTYNGRRFVSGSTVVTTVDNYYINDVKIEGTRTVTNITNSSEEAPKFNATLVGGKAIFTDQRTATRESDITTEWVRADSPLNDELIITGSAEGTTRAGRSYTVEVLTALHYRRGCSMAVQGIKKYTLDNGKEITIDYGDGDCDRKVTVTVNGATRDLNI